MGFLGIIGAPNVDKAAARGNLEELLRCAKYKKDPEIRRKAIEALTTHIDFLITSLESRNVRKIAIARDCLKQVGEPSVTRLADVYEHGDTLRRCDAVHMMGEIGLPSGLPTVRAALKDPEPEVRLLALRSVVALDPPDAEKLLSARLRDRDEGVRLRARKELDRLEKKRRK